MIKTRLKSSSKNFFIFQEQEVLITLEVDIDVLHLEVEELPSPLLSLYLSLFDPFLIESLPLLFILKHCHLNLPVEIQINLVSWDFHL